MGNRDLPTDVLVEILLRLPPSSRRRARLVCRLWRDIIGERATDSSQAVALLWGISSGVAYIVDDLSTGRRRELWRSPSGRPVTTNLHNDWQLVGTCNGLLCVCRNGGATIGGEITLVNPATSETLSVPPLPCNGHFRRERLCRWEWDRAYNFAYHPKSGRYKVVHVPCSFDGVYEYDAVHVLRLGDGAWREVPAPGGARCNLNAGIISVDGVTYWATGHDRGAKIFSFDLDNEHIAASSMSLPYMPARHGGYDYNLTEVHGRLGVIFGNPSGKTEAWAWHEEVEMWTPVAILTCECQEIPRPHFASGEYFLMCEGYVNVIRKDKGTLVAKMNGGGYKFEYRAFAYVKTLESLRVYAAK